MEKDYLKEAFKALEELNEDVFDISLSDGLEDAKDFMEEPVDDREEEIIIDPLAETEEDLEKDYLGKAILQCEVCQSMIYKNPDEVVIDEEVGLANVDEACPFCQSEDGFKVIGQIEEFCDDEECEHKDDVDKEDKDEEEIEVKETEEDEEEIEESIKTRKKLRLKESKKLKEDWDWNGDLPKIADEMAKAFDKMDFISRDDFDEQFALACRKILGIDNIWEEDTITIDGKERDILGDVEPDIRVILSLQNNYETEFEGDNEGGLRLVESKSRDDIDADTDDKIERAKKALKKRIDDADSIRDERKKSAKKQFRKAQDDADSDRDYKLKKKGLKESQNVSVEEYYITFIPGTYLSDKYDGEFITEDEAEADSLFNQLDENNELCDVEQYYKKAWVWEDGRYVEDYVTIYYSNLNHNFNESCKSRKSKKSLKESDKQAATSIKDAQKWVDYDMKKYGKISAKTNRLVKKAGFQIIKDDHGDYEVTAGKFESLKEDTESIKLFKTGKHTGKYDDYIKWELSGLTSANFDKYMGIIDSKFNDSKYTPDYETSDTPSPSSTVNNTSITFYTPNSYSKDDVKNILGIESLKEDTIKRDGEWVNKGKEGTHGKFRTKKEADAQRRAIWVNWNK